MQSATNSHNSQAWLWTLVAFSFLSQTALNLARPQMSYKLLGLGANEALIGMLTALYALVPVFMAIGFGRYTERVVNLRYTVMAGGILIGVGAAVMALAPHIVGVALASVLLGFGHLIFVIASQASVARYSTDAGLDKGFGWQTAGISAGQLLGPLLGGLVLGNSTGDARMHLINLSLWVGAGFALISIPLMLWPIRVRIMPALTSDIPVVTETPTSPNKPRIDIRKDASPRSTPGVGATEEKATTWAILKKPGITSHMYASLAMLSITDILVSFLPLVGESVGVSPAWVGVLLAIRSAASIASRSSLTAMTQKWNRTQLVITSLLVSCVVIAVVPLCLTSTWISVLAMIVGGFFVGIAQPLSMTMIIKQVPMSWRSPALAVRLMGNRLGQVFIPLVAGAIAAPMGPAGAIWFCCALIGTSGVEKTIRYLKTGPTAADQ